MNHAIRTGLLASGLGLASLFALSGGAPAQPRPPAAIQETMEIGDEPGRVSSEEATITDGPYACPSSDDLRLISGLRKGGSGSSGFKAMRLASGAASVLSGWSGA